MPDRCRPALGLRYWVAISIASVFGANLGDFASHAPGLGHARGLPIYAVIFVAILFAARRGGLGQPAYWLAIVTLRAAATNLADLATHDLRLGYVNVIVGLAVLLLLLQAVGRTARVELQPAMPAVSGVPTLNLRYWLCMLVAGTLGTAAGDYAAGMIGLVTAALLFLAILLATLAARRLGPAFSGKRAYWFTIVVIRTVGTNAGDLLADAVGLSTATVASGALLIGTLALWRTPHTDLGRPDTSL